VPLYDVQELAVFSIECCDRASFRKATRCAPS
jgi:hypothetical protein